MTPCDAFLQDIHDNPDDDAVRLIFADWLAEQGDPASVARGDFIRLQIQLAGLTPADPRWRALKFREQELWQTYQEEWSASLRGLARRWTFRRGFPEDVEMTVQEFADRADALFEAVPVLQVHLLKVSSQLQRLECCEQLRRVRALSLSYSYLNDQAARVLARCPYLEELRVLLLDHNFIRSAGAETLSRSPYLSHLRVLDLRGNQLGSAGRQAIVDRFGPAVRL